jgi:hypothetical protein
MMRRRRQVRLDDALVAAADETAVDETEAGGADTAGDATVRRAHGSARRRGEGEGEDDGAEGTDDAVAARLTAGNDDGVRATCDEAGDDDRDAATGGGDAGDDGDGDDDGGGDEGETRGGDGGDGGGEASGGSVATTGGGDAGDGGGDGGGGGQRPAKRQRGERKGRAGSIRRERAAKGR